MSFVVPAGDSGERFPYLSLRANSIFVLVIVPSIYIGTPGSTLNFFSVVFPTPAISIVNT